MGVVKTRGEIQLSTLVRAPGVTNRPPHACLWKRAHCLHDLSEEPVTPTWLRATVLFQITEEETGIHRGDSCRGLGLGASGLGVQAPAWCAEPCDPEQQAVPRFAWSLSAEPAAPALRSSAGKHVGRWKEPPRSGQGSQSNATLGPGVGSSQFQVMASASACRASAVGQAPKDSTPRGPHCPVLQN